MKSRGILDYVNIVWKLFHDWMSEYFSPDFILLVNQIIMNKSFKILYLIHFQEVWWLKLKFEIIKLKKLWPECVTHLQWGKVILPNVFLIAFSIAFMSVFVDLIKSFNVSSSYVIAVVFIEIKTNCHLPYQVNIVSSRSVRLERPSSFPLLGI